MEEHTQEEFTQMTEQLKKMGVRFENIGKPQAASLPPLPSTDAKALERNTYSSFYKTGARDFWQHSETERIELQPFKKCTKHNFVERPDDKVMCTICHIGWIVPQSFSIRDGDLYDGETPMRFAQ